MKDDIVIDGYQVIRSNCVLTRVVHNDANVGQWGKVGENTDTVPVIRSKADLVKWMNDGIHDPSILEREGFDEHVYSYGPRFQFWVPKAGELAEAERKEVQGKVLMVECTDAVGLSNVTEGASYKVLDIVDGMYVLKDDDGRRTEFFKERFKKYEQEVVG